ncbi:hypothetical protein NSB25_12495 [Acetatifactor muris]|jgi:hypothetical protein|uniref:Uncharacterized protein n=1 Tax=Acetatifactor muris TaxID=879566 RepID=A0A2K4ZH77_9FIRM|nr:hypothetical protein [Acetatifactor muris]MCI8799610.1 hypothetical protein [Lachnospiraceae bacterium]MCR2048107.1 hypothetical protein [Acetatifactor muris]SOY29815.1 hypothetical protein AMURIS_02536 [Acetatifactor muris]
MEFHSKLLQPLPENKVRGWNGPLPFYMTYPDYQASNREAMLLQDLEYLQQMYPNDVKRYQKRIADMLDKADYEGSMIYDEYPDRYSLLAMTKSICGVLEKEESEAPGEAMIQVLLFNEVYKRRHGGHRGNYYFI